MQNSFLDPVEIVWRQGTEACAGSLLETLVGLRCMLRTELWEGFGKKWFILKTGKYAQFDNQQFFKKKITCNSRENVQNLTINTF